MPQRKANQPDSLLQGRRRFLRSLSVAGVAAIPLSAAAGTAEQATLPGARENRADRVRARYRADAPDVQAFYRVNRY